MKKLLMTICLLLALVCALALAEEATGLTWTRDGNKVTSSRLNDGKDSTVVAIAAETQQGMQTRVKGEIRSAYIRTQSKLEKVQLQYRDADKKWVTVAEAINPPAELVLRSPQPITGDIRVLFTYESRRATKLAELRLFENELNPDLHDWQNAITADVLVLCDSLEDIDPELMGTWTATGRSVLVCSLSHDEKDPLPAQDRLWDAGLSMLPRMGGFRASAQNAEKTLKSWGRDKVAAQVEKWIADAEARVVIWVGDVMPMVLEDLNLAVDVQMADYAMDAILELGDMPALEQPEEPAVTEEPEVQAETTPEPAAEATAAPAAVSTAEPTAEPTPEPTAEPVQSAYVRVDYTRPEYFGAYAAAEHADVNEIPYPMNRTAEGYLPEGEFIYRNADDKGLWAYLSPTLQVEIVRYTVKNPAQSYFVADVKFDVNAEQLKVQEYEYAKMKNQMIWPKTLAQSSRMVLAVNSDFYFYRVDHNQTKGNILRNGRVLYNLTTARGNDTFPNLDTMALHDDGSMSVYAGNEITADKLQAMGTVHDALSFGPYLIRNGELRNYTGKNYDKIAPRTAIGMIEPGHYIVLVVEAGITGSATVQGAKGMTITEVGNLMYAFGCNEGFMLDGGSTSVMLFMGDYINRTGHMDTGKLSTPRNQNELLGIGRSEEVDTDWFDGRPKK